MIRRMSMVPGQDFQRRLDSEYPAAMERHQAELGRPFSKVPKRTRVIALVILAALAIFVAIAAWTVVTARPDRNSATARAAVGRMIGVVAATPDRGQVDFAQALDVPWDRAVMIAPYTDGAAMNARLGFDWYSASDVSTRVVTAQFVVFVQDRTVVAEAELAAGTFRFDSFVKEFTRAQGVFNVVRSANDTVLQMR
jgi:hypothetical protein